MKYLNNEIFKYSNIQRGYTEAKNESTNYNVAYNRKERINVAKLFKAKQHFLRFESLQEVS